MNTESATSSNNVLVNTIKGGLAWGIVLAFALLISFSLYSGLSVKKDVARDPTKEIGDAEYRDLVELAIDDRSLMSMINDALKNDRIVDGREYDHIFASRANKKDSESDGKKMLLAKMSVWNATTTEN